MSTLNQFEKQQYLNIETFRKNGVSVKTPVWFVQAGNQLYVWTEASSGKAKRIRNTARVNIVPSKGDGSPVGTWVPATAVYDDSQAALEHLKALMAKKYGFAFMMFGLLGRMRGSKYTSIKISI